MRFLLFISFSFTHLLLYGQKHDYVWTFGYNGDSDSPLWEATNLDFNFSFPESIPSNRSLWLGATNASISDKNGELLAFTNGFTILDKNDQILINGDSINPGYRLRNYYSSGFPNNYGAFFLPNPGDVDQYYLFHFNQDTIVPDINYIYHQLNYSLLDFSNMNNTGEVIKKDVLIDEGAFHPAAACKHGNGRDWWVLYPSTMALSRDKHLLLVTPDSISQPETQSIGDVSPIGASGGMKKCFSPDGSLYIQMDAFYGIQFYDFDRCTGLLSNLRVLKFDHTEKWYAGNGEFSPDGRFFYFSSNTELMQLDFREDTIAWSAVDTIAENPSIAFWHHQLGPDGKIYISTFSTAPYLHIIHNPNEKGTACNFEDRGITLAGYHRKSLPYFPNYRLGALEGSPCDTITTSSTYIEKQSGEIEIFPNPSSGTLNIKLPELINQDVRIEFYNHLGQGVYAVSEWENRHDISLNTSSFSDGLYFLRVYSGDDLLSIKKLIIQK